MANFFEDNADMRSYLDHPLLREIAKLQEGDFAEAETCPYAPEDVEDALDNYRRVLSLVGELCGDFVAPRAEEVDREGPHFRDGRVEYPRGISESVQRFAQADLMGFTLPRKYGGLNMPFTIYTSAIELISRADAALMTIVGLQDIAETIHAFADDETKGKYLPMFARGEITSAMVLTEPDAGSDLQAVQTRGGISAMQDEQGHWHINGVKRFITNGCGDILLVLARTEPNTTDGRGLSLFLVEKNDCVRIRRIENKMGIHGSPTCEMQFTDSHGILIGRRKFGLIKYVMSLMNGARLGIAAQSLGIAEAACREALGYARDREQSGKAIIEFPAVYEMLVRMKMNIEAARALVYHTAMVVDFEKSLETKLEADPSLRAEHSQYAKAADVLTPMAKYYASELCNRVAYNALQIHGGSGYMKEYAVERLTRDARITTIYEGTTQLQIVAAVRGVMGGNLQSHFDAWKEKTYPGGLQPLARKLRAAQERLATCVEFVKQTADQQYTDFHARRLVDVAMESYIGYLLLDQAETSEHNTAVARMFISDLMPRLEMNAAYISSGDRTVIDAREQLLA